MSVLIYIYAYNIIQYYIAISGYWNKSESVTSKLCSFGVESGSRQNTEMIFNLVETKQSFGSIVQVKSPRLLFSLLMNAIGLNNNNKINDNKYVYVTS